MTRLPDVIGAIGSDRYLTRAEVPGNAGDPRAVSAAWQLYESGFDGFCGTTLDPLFHRLAHPARSLGTLVEAPDAPVLVVGTGPSTGAALPVLRQIRDSVRLFTSPRGAELLAGHGLQADLILVEHQTALDAHHSARHLGDTAANVLATGALVAADWRTPAALLRDVRPDRLFVPDRIATWGLWPATLVAMAADGGARRIGLLGVDLGTPQALAAEFAPLEGLLALLAGLLGGVTVDCGADGAAKRGWPGMPLKNFAGAHALRPVALARRAAPPAPRREAEARAALARLTPQVAAARACLAAGLAGRDGVADVVALRAAADTLMAWGCDARLRADLQDTLGINFLPRLWRLGMDADLGAALWRPIVLATHELVHQADRLDATLARRAA